MLPTLLIISIAFLLILQVLVAVHWEERLAPGNVLPISFRSVKALIIRFNYDLDLITDLIYGRMHGHVTL